MKRVFLSFLLLYSLFDAVTGFLGRGLSSKQWSLSRSVARRPSMSAIKQPPSLSLRLSRSLSLRATTQEDTNDNTNDAEEKEEEEGTVYMHTSSDAEHRAEEEKARRYERERVQRPWIGDEPEDALIYDDIDHSDAPEPLTEPHIPSTASNATMKRLKANWRRFATPNVLEREEEETPEGQVMPGWAESEREADAGDRMSWFDPGDLGYLDVRDSETDFALHFLAVGVLAQDRFREREMLWDYHLQWMRRTQLALYVSPEIARECVSGRCSVSRAYTALSYDRLTPVAQLLYISANSTEDVRNYLQSEPLEGEGVLRWRLARRQEREESEEEDEIPRAPFFFLHLHKENKDPKDNNGDLLTGNTAAEAWSEVYRNSRAFHSRALNCEDSSLLFDRMSRVVSLSSLHAVQNHVETPNEECLPEEMCGQAMLFNAKSSADALRYVQKDPAGAALKAGQQLMENAVIHNEDSITMLAPVNMLDCDGRAQITFTSDEDFERGAGLGDESPEELLYSTEYVFQDRRAQEHFAENDRILSLLRREGVIINVPDSVYESDRVDPKLEEQEEEQYEPLSDLRVGELVHFALEKDKASRLADEQAEEEAESTASEEERVEDAAIPLDDIDTELTSDQ